MLYSMHDAQCLHWNGACIAGLSDREQELEIFIYVEKGAVWLYITFVSVKVYREPVK